MLVFACSHKHVLFLGEHNQIFLNMRTHIPFLYVDLRLTVTGMTPLFGPDALCDSVLVGFIQQYCSTTGENKLST